MPRYRPRTSPILPRVALVAFALGLSLAGPQIGLANAESGRQGSPAAGDTTASPASDVARETNTTRGPRSTGPRSAGPRSTLGAQRNDSPTSAPVRPRRAVLVQQEPTAIEALGPAPAPVVVIPATGLPERTAASPLFTAVTAAPADAAPPAVSGPEPNAGSTETVTAVPHANLTLGIRLSDVLAGHSPTPPAGILAWAVLAAASRETFAPADVDVTGIPPMTTALAIPKTPLFTALRLQYLPIIGHCWRLRSSRSSARSPS